jgi:putative membrane protein
MADEENKKGEPKGKGPEDTMNEIKNIHPVPDSKDMERKDLTETQKKIEEQVTKDEGSLTGDELSTALSRNRTHMSEHRTGLSEHRTDLSEHRTGLSEHRTDLSEHRSELSESRTHLSYQRTALSYERTLMSWIRTAVSLISFGFTIYKFFDDFQKTNTDGHRIFTPRGVGICMILFGFLGLLFAQIQHQQAIKQLRKEYPDIKKSLSSVLGILVLVFGLVLLLAAVFRQ